LEWVAADDDVSGEMQMELETHQAQTIINLIAVCCISDEKSLNFLIDTIAFSFPNQINYMLFDRDEN